MAHTAIPSLTVANLDFTSIKTSLKAYLSTLPAFKDVDFEGGTAANLVDALAYNTYWNMYYTNMLSNEMFLDTAQRRNSVVSLARMLGYVPRSTVSARADLTVTITANDSPASITIPPYTTFQTLSSSDDTAYTFYTTAAHTIHRDTPTQTTYRANVTVTEGTRLTHQFTVNTANPNQRFVLPNANVDWSTLSVTVQASAVNNTQHVFARANTVHSLNSDSKIYFVYETYDGLSELLFGNGVVGQALEDQNIVIVDYFVSNGPHANKTARFRAPAAINGYTTIDVALQDSATPASGGDDKEDIESIRYLAPLTYQTQGRAVTAQDFQTILQSEVGGIESLAVWGGEDGDPRTEDDSPIYGTVFVSIKPRGAESLTEGTKARIINTVLKDRMVLTMQPVLIDPDFVYLVIDSTVKYNPTRTTLSADEVKARVLTAMVQYANTELSRFGSYFRFSQFVKAVDDSHMSITNSLTTLTLEKRFEPDLTERNNYTLNFGNPLFFRSDAATVTSATRFTHTDEQGVPRTGCFLENDGLVMKMYRFEGTTKVTVRSNIGSVDFTKGRVKLIGFQPTTLTAGTDTTGKKVMVRAVPATSDILPTRNQLLQLGADTVSITMYDDTQSYASTGTTGGQQTGGGAAGGGGYVLDI
jgi:hypothetical protein